MRKTLTISLPEDVKKALDRVSAEEGIARSELIRESLREFLFFRRFRRLRSKMLRKAEKQGVFTDEDVFEKIS